MGELALELAGIPAFAGLSETALEWLAAHMTVANFAPGEILIHAGAPADRMMVILAGEIRGVVETGPDRTIFTSRAGQVTGMLPFSRLTIIPVTIHAMEPLRVAWLYSSLFPEMLALFPDLGPRLVGVMSDRIRENTRAGDQREKLAALGKLSAGLAHELNNPAGAAQRAARSLRETIAIMRAAERQIGRQMLTPEQRERVAEIAQHRLDHGHVVDSLERSDREQELGAWLDGCDVEDAWGLAANLAEVGFDLPKVKEVAREFPAETAGCVLRRVASSLLTERLLDELDSSTTRVTELVRAIKEYSFMDRGEEQEVDVHQGIESTLVMLKHRLKNGVKVVRQFDADLPRLRARGGELNQVWTNLIDNAVDAMHGKGELHIRTARDMNGVLVEIGDNGAGVPEEIQPRIFEPFFTTKGVGEGTGLGLDMVARIVRTHRGNVRLQSRPGDTRFQVWLPLEKGGGQS